MKKVFAVAALSMLVLTSCIKTRTCDCGDGDTFSVSGTKSQSKTLCEGYGSGCTLSK